MIKFILFLLAFCGLAITSPLYADIAVRGVDGVPVVSVKGARVAVFQPQDNELWLVAGPGRRAVSLPEARAGAGHLSSAWKIELLQVSNGQGVRIIGAAARTWGLKRTNDGWQAKPGEQNEVPPADKINAIVLYDKIDASVPSMVAVAADGTRFKVFPAVGRVVGVDDTRVIAGLVEGLGSAYAAISPAAGPENGHAGAVIPMTKGHSIKAVAMLEAAEEELAPAHLQWQAPGEVIPFTLPKGWGKRGEEVVPMGKLKRGLEQAVTAGAVEEAANAVEKVGELVEKISKTDVFEAPGAAHDLPSDVVKSLKEKDDFETLPGVKGRLETVDADALMIWPEVDNKSFILKEKMARDAVENALRACTALPDKLLVSIEKGVEPDAGDEAVTDGAGEVHGGKTEGEQGPSGDAEKPTDGAEKHSNVNEASMAQSAPGKLAVAWGIADYNSCNNQLNVRAARIKLARFYLAADRPMDALAVLDLLPQQNVADGLTGAVDIEGRFLQLIGLSMARDTKQAAALLDQTAWPKAWGEQIAVWTTAVRESQGRHAAAIDAWPREQNDVLKAYPNGLRMYVQRQLAEAEVAAGNMMEAQMFVDSLAERYAELGEDNVPAWLNRLRGLVRLGGANERQGIAYLAEAANQTHDAETAARAKYEYVSQLAKTEQITTPQVIAYLDELRMFWRGDDLELKILEQLGDLYLADKDYRRALENWRLLVQIAPSTEDMDRITDKMTNALLLAFDPEEGIPYTPLAFAGMYYDYKELLPIDARGDRVTERVADLMAEMGLVDRALPLYNQILQNAGLEKLDEARISLKLAEAYRQNRDAAQALRTLDMHQKSAAINTVTQYQWKLGEARALIDLERFDAAEKALKNVKGDEADALRADIAWNTQKWADVTKILQPKLAKMATAEGNVDKLPIEVLRMAYAAGRMEDTSVLADLSQKFASVLAKDPLSADMLAAIVGDAGISSTLPGLQGSNGSLGVTAQTLRNMNAVADQAQAAREEVIEEEQERQEFNDKMRYMELLPPPVI